MVRTDIALSWLVGVAMVATAACGGTPIPDHDGYRGTATGWKRPTPLVLDEDLEAEDDTELSYPERRRSRWYEVTLPQDGSLTLQVSYTPLSGESEADDGLEFEEEDESDEIPFDVAFELYDENYRRLLRADYEDDDAGERKRNRVVSNLPKGRYLIHLYVHRRLDRAECTLFVQLKPGVADVETDFPRQVAFVPALPVVPLFDDAPPPRKRTRGSRPRSNKPEDDDKSAGSLAGRIIGVRGSAGGTTITINRGKSHGVATGWKGEVVHESGKAIPNGTFTITEVKDTRSTATVKATADSVNEARHVRLRAP
jgi:hypothetical protein